MPELSPRELLNILHAALETEEKIIQLEQEVAVLVYKLGGNVEITEADFKATMKNFHGFHSRFNEKTNNWTVRLLNKEECPEHNHEEKHVKKRKSYAR